MSICQHLPYKCIRVSYRNINKCITDFNHLTRITDIINIFLNELTEKEYLTINDCCLYIEYQSYLYPLKSTDFIQDIIYRYSSSDICFKLIFKRHSSPSRFAQRKKLNQITIKNPYEQLRLQELLIQKQQEIINQLTKINDDNNRVSTNTRQSRQDEYYEAVNHETTRSHSRVRFRLSTVTPKYEVSSSLPTPVITEVKSILKKSSIQRTSSVDRDIEKLISLKHEENSFSISDNDDDDDDLSDQSTTDSCLGSLSSNDSVYHLETLV